MGLSTNAVPSTERESVSVPPGVGFSDIAFATPRTEHRPFQSHRESR